MYFHNVFIMNTYVFLSFSSLPSWHCSAQLGWRLLGWGQSNSLRQAQCDMFWLFTYTLIQVLIMFVLSARIKSAGKSEKHETEFIRSHHYHSGNKKKHCSHTHARLHTHTHTRTPQVPRTNASYMHSTHWTHTDATEKHHCSFHTQMLPYLETYADTHTTATTFISSVAQQVFGCRSINIDSHFDSLLFILSIYSFIHLYISCQRPASCRG